jgi:hypothetical protein
MMPKASTLFAVGVTLASAAGEVDKRSLTTLKRIVYVRGFSCNGCSQAEYRALANKVEV